MKIIWTPVSEYQRAEIFDYIAADNPMPQKPLSLRERGWGEGAGTRVMLDGASAEHPHPPFGHLLPEGEGNSKSLFPGRRRERQSLRFVCN